MTRFLRYAMEHDRKIRMLFLLDGEMLQRTVSVLAFDEKTVTLRIGSRKAPVTFPIEDILSCDYARGDHGEE